MSNEIKIAIIGVGNCASALVQGLQFSKSDNVGIRSEYLGKYRVDDIKVVLAIDVNREKVGKPLTKAIFCDPNCADFFLNGNIKRNGCDPIVKPGRVFDGISDTYSYRKFEVVQPGVEPSETEVIRWLKESGADMAINYLPVGSRAATRFYADCCLLAGVSFINCIPEFIGTDESYQQKFLEAGLCLVGDDIKSQVGATILHRTIVDMIRRRGQTIDSSYQLNFGGNSDFENMLNRTRLESKKISKTEAVESMARATDFDGLGHNLKIGPSDFVHYLKDQKIAYINISGRQFGGVPYDIEIKLRVHDSPNSAGVVVDAIRATKLALDAGRYGYLQEVSAWGFKRPQEQVNDVEADADFFAFINELTYHRAS